MPNSNFELIREVTTLAGYTYRVWEYQASLSQLTVRAYDPNKPEHNVHIVFQNVVYFQMPTYWETGNFRLGSEAEHRSIAKRIGLDDFKSGVLFKADTSKGIVYVFGVVVGVLRDVEPLY